MAGNPILYLDAQWKKGLKEDLNAKLQKFKFDKLNVEVGFDDKKLVSNINKIVKEVQKLLNNVNSINIKANPMEGLATGVRDATVQYKKLEYAIQKVQEKATASLSNHGNKELSKQLEQLVNLFGNLEEAKKRYESSDATKKDVQNYKNIVGALQLQKTVVTDLIKSNNDLAKAEAKVFKEQGKFNDWINSLGNALKEPFGDSIDAINNAFDEMSKSGSTNFGKVNILINELKANMAVASKSTIQLTDAMDKSAAVIDSIYRKITQLFALGSLLKGAKSLLSKAYTEVKAIDSAMVDLKKVTDETADAYARFLGNASERAVRLGSTISDVVQITANWAKLGYGLNDAEKLAESSIIYANVADVQSVDDAVQHLTTTIKAFDMDANESLTIVDRYNELSNKFAVTAQGLGAAMKTAASALALGGNDLDQSLAMITGITEITGNAVEAGNALRTISMRVRAAKLELEKAGEDTEGVVRSTAELRDLILAITKFDITKSSGELKSTYEIIQGIAKTWKDLDSNTQGALLEKLAGKNRANQLAALLTNWGQVEEAFKASENSVGSALREQEKYAESIEFKVTQIKAVLQDLYQNILNSDTVKTILDLTKGILDVVNKIVKGVGTLPVVLGGIGGIIGKKTGTGAFGSTITNTVKSFIQGGWRNRRGSTFGGSILTREDIALVEQYNHAIEIGVTNTNELNTVIEKISNNALKDEMSSLNGAKFATEEFAKASQVATIKTTLLSAGLSALVGVGISLAIAGIKELAKYIHTFTYEGQIEQLKEAQKQYSETASEINDLNKSLEDNKKRIDEINNSGFTLGSQSEVLLLQQENSELSTQIDYLNEIQKLRDIENKKRAKDAYNTFNRRGVGLLNGYATSYDKNSLLYGLETNPFASVSMADLGGYFQDTLTDLGSADVIDIDKISLISKHYQEWIDKQVELKTTYEELGLTGEAEYQVLVDNIESAMGWFTNFTREVLGLGDAVGNASMKIDELGESTNKSREGLKQLTKEFSKTKAEGSSLRSVLEKLEKDVPLEEIFDADADALKNLLSEFPQLKNAIDDYSDGLIGAFDIQKQFQDLMYDFEAGQIYDKFENLNKAVKEYGDGSLEAERAARELIDSSPILANALDTLGIKFSVAELASYSSSDAFLAAALAEAQATLASQQTDLSNYQRALSDAALTARTTQSDFQRTAAQLIMTKNLASMVDTQAAINKTNEQIKQLSNLKVSGVKVNNSRSSKNGGSSREKGSGGSRKSSSKTKSILSDEYNNQVNLNEYYIKLSEERQKRMNKDTDEYRQETAKQYAYYKNLAEQTYAEIQRLQSKGYDESNEEYRKLVQAYSGYLSDIYSESEDIWNSLNDSQKAKLEGEIKVLENQQKELNKLIDLHKDEIKLNDERIDKLKEENAEYDEAIDATEDLIDARREAQKEREKQLDFEIEKNNAIIALEQEHYGVIKDIKAEQADLNNQLKASMESYQYLDDETRKLLFNEDDYGELSKQLNTIAEEATQMYDDYLERLNNVTEETAYELEYITDEFERQYELKLKEYEIAKQELSVAKARKELENTSKERNVRMLVNGQWTWVADPNKVKSAIENVGNAERDYTASQDDLTQTKVIQNLQEQNSNLALTKNRENAELESDIKYIQDEIIGYYESLKDSNNNLIKSLEASNKELNDYIKGYQERIDLLDDEKELLQEQLDALKDVVYNFTEFSKKLEEGTGVLAQAIDAINSRTLSSEMLKGFADGGVVDYTGLAMVHGGRGHGAETVLNNTDTAKLYSLIHNSPNLYEDILDRIRVPMASGSIYSGNMGTTNSTNVYIDGVSLNSQDSESLVEIFKRVIPIAR